KRTAMIIPGINLISVLLMRSLPRTRIADPVYTLKTDLGYSPEIILQPHDVVLAQIIAALHFDKDHRGVAGVLDPVRRAYRDVDVFAGAENDFFVVESNLRRALHDEPVLGAARVFLIAQPFSWQNLNAFDFVSLALVEDGEITPGALIITWRIIFRS